MGIRYLKGLSWAEVTREERFFCARLHNLVETRGVLSFIGYLNEKENINLDAKANWEMAYEACFYRDLWQLHKKNGELYSPKRTFDLCLLSDDAIVVIEAKAQQGFDPLQVQEFVNDKEQLKKATSVSQVLLVGLVSSKYVDDMPEDIKLEFDGILTWAEMAAAYHNDAILRRADTVYESTGFTSFGKNNTSGCLSGAELLKAFDKGAEFFVGRSLGLDGSLLERDISSGMWESHQYETNRTTSTPPNPNWFRLSEFVTKVRSK